MTKLCFIGNSQSPLVLLNTFNKMTPGRLGIWGQLEGTGNIDEADYFAVIDKVPYELRDRIPAKKCVLLGAHPETGGNYQNMSNIEALVKFDCNETIGFLEWWIKYDYDYLTQLKPMTKTDLLGTIVSNSMSDKSHHIRRAFLERACSKYPGMIDVWGRIIPTGSIVPHYKGVCGQRANTANDGDYWSGKEPIYERYKYMIEFDNIGKYYFSERILDCMFLWAMPLYWGGNGLHLFLPEASFRYLNIDGSGEDVNAIIHTDFYEQHLDDLTKAREILLNELQIWARVHKAIFGVCK